MNANDWDAIGVGAGCASVSWAICAAERSRHRLSIGQGRAAPGGGQASESSRTW